MKEIWKDIKGYKGKYQVSSLGRVRKNKTKEIVKFHLDKQHYIIFSLKGKRVLGHRLVAEAFLGLNISDSNAAVCHKDDITTNNEVSNLFVATQQQNIEDAINKGRMPNLNNACVLVIYASLRRRLRSTKLFKGKGKKYHLAL